MNEYLLWLLIVLIGSVVIGVAYTLLKRFLQDRDFKRQIEGKIPERKPKEENSRTKSPETFNNDFEIEKNRLRSSNKFGV